MNKEHSELMSYLHTNLPFTSSQELLYLDWLSRFNFKILHHTRMSPISRFTMVAYDDAYDEEEFHECFELIECGREPSATYARRTLAEKYSDSHRLPTLTETGSSFSIVAARLDITMREMFLKTQPTSK